MLLAEQLVESLLATVERLKLTETFLGVTVIAIVPALTEFINGIQFSVQNDIKLSLEIGSAASVQIALIQIPILVLFSGIMQESASASFTLIFPTLNVFTVIFAVIVLNYISSEGKANYFIGSVLVIIYILMIGPFYYTPDESMMNQLGNKCRRIFG